MSKTERLQNFIAWWKMNIRGDEKGEAQIFLDRLVQAFGHAGALEVGVYETRVRRKRNGKTSVSFDNSLAEKHVPSATHHDIYQPNS